MEPPKAKALTIGLVARRAGIGVETVRFYERQGLIEEPPRRLSGYREYDDEVVSRLGFIRRAKDSRVHPQGNQGTTLLAAGFIHASRRRKAAGRGQDRRH